MVSSNPTLFPIRLRLALLAIGLMVGVRPAYAADGFGQRFLDEPTIAAVGKSGEIRINFTGAIRYIRHFPEKKGATLKVALEVVDPCLAEDVVAQESGWLPAADWHVPVTITFPDSIKRSATGPAVCADTHNQVYTGHTLALKFGKEVEYKVRPGSDGHSIIVTVPLLKQPDTMVAEDSKKTIPVTTASSGVAQTKDSASLEPSVPAADMLAAGKAALDAGNAVEATRIFNQLLNLPPNQNTEAAQELVGLAREKEGEVDKARAEYELYLKLYPNGDGVGRVKQRLAVLEGVKKAAAKDEGKPAKDEGKKAVAKRGVREIHQDTFTGSVSQYFYSGKSQSSSENGAGEVNKQRSTDQATLITNVDATGRFRRNQYDTKIVFRDTEVHNAMAKLTDRNTVSAAYIEHQNKLDDYMFRIGRQSGTSQGVLGRFDGIYGRYGINPQWRITAVAGEPDNGTHNKVVTNRHFYGAGVEFGPLAEKWSGTVYGIQQVADGTVERRAVGTELRYFSGTTSGFGMVDYDTVYHEVNIAMLQGNWTAAGGYNFNLLLDHRKSPILYGELGIQAISGARSVGSVRELLSSSEMYSYIKALVPESDMAMFGVTKQLNDRWQVGGDVRVSHIGSTEGIPGRGDPLDPTNPFIAVPATPAIDNNYTLTLQAIGTNTIFKNDTSVAIVSFTEDPTYNAQNVSFSNSLALRDNWRIDTSMNYYQEERDAGQKTWKINPHVRLHYRLRDNLSFEAEFNVDRTHTDDPIAVTKTTSWRESLFAGYRWDFR